MSLPDARPLSVLTIAGSDSGGGAGIQGDEGEDADAGRGDDLEFGRGIPQARRGGHRQAEEGRAGRRNPRGLVVMRVRES